MAWPAPLPTSRPPLSVDECNYEIYEWNKEGKKSVKYSQTSQISRRGRPKEGKGLEIPPQLLGWENFATWYSTEIF